MYDVELFKEKKLPQQEMVLKYFYLIDAANIIEGFSEYPMPKDPGNMQQVDDFFHSVFEKIFTASSMYNKYLDPPYNTFNSFFGEPGCTSNSGVDYFSYNSRLGNMRVFLKLSLRNHCITQSFFNILSEKNSDNHVFLSSKYEKFLDSGYFENPEYRKEDYGEVGDDGPGPDSMTPQAFNRKFNSLKKLGEDSFVWKVLMDSSLYMNGPIPPADTRFDFKVPTVYKHWVYSFFKNIEVFTLSRHIKEGFQNTDKFYSKIYNDFHETENGLEHPLDKFIFHTMGEYYLGFSTISYANRLMKKIHKPLLDEDHYLKRYRGQILESILKHLSYFHMPYARHLFLAYALEALRYNEVVECKFLSSGPDVMMKRSPMKAPFTEEERDARGLQLIPRFINTLNQITVPVLSSLWKIVLEKLIDDKGLLLELYKAYIESHYNLLTADFSTLSFDDMAYCCSEKRVDIPKNDICASFSLNALMEKLNLKTPKGTGIFSDGIFSQKDLSPIIRDFLRMSQEDPGPSFSPQIFREVETNGKNKGDGLVERFRFNRANNIFEIFSSKWF